MQLELSGHTFSNLEGSNLFFLASSIASMKIYFLRTVILWGSDCDKFDLRFRIISSTVRLVIQVYIIISTHLSNNVHSTSISHCRILIWKIQIKHQYIHKLHKNSYLARRFTTFMFTT